MAFHLNLKHIVIVDEITSQIWQARVLDNNSSRHVLGDQVVLDECRCFFLSQEATGVIVKNLVLFNKSFGANKDYSIEVIVYGIFLNQKFLLSFDYKNTFTFRVFDHVKFDLGFP